MSDDSSKPSVVAKRDQPVKKPKSKKQTDWRAAFKVPLWVLLSFGLAQIVFVAIYQLLRLSGVPVDALNPAVFNSIAAAFIYSASLAIALLVPYVAYKSVSSLKLLGIDSLPTWKDIGLAPIAFAFYFVLSGLLLFAAGSLFDGFNLEQVQETGFEAIGMRYEYIVAFVTLVIIAPIAEEVLFRGYLYGRLRKAIPLWLAIIVTSALFGLVHGQWNVAIDTFALSVLMCGLREVTGSIWAGTLLHMLKNAVAFYFLFVNPLMDVTMGL